MSDNQPQWAPGFEPPIDPEPPLVPGPRDTLQGEPTNDRPGPNLAERPKEERDRELVEQVRLAMELMDKDLREGEISEEDHAKIKAEMLAGAMEADYPQEAFDVFAGQAPEPPGDNDAELPTKEQIAAMSKEELRATLERIQNLSNEREQGGNQRASIIMDILDRITVLQPGNQDRIQQLENENRRQRNEFNRSQATTQTHVRELEEEIRQLRDNRRRADTDELTRSREVNRRLREEITDLNNRLGTEAAQCEAQKKKLQATIDEEQANREIVVDALTKSQRDLKAAQKDAAKVRADLQNTKAKLRSAEKERNVNRDRFVVAERQRDAALRAVEVRTEQRDAARSNIADSKLTADLENAQNEILQLKADLDNMRAELRVAKAVADEYSTHVEADAKRQTMDEAAQLNLSHQLVQEQEKCDALKREIAKLERGAQKLNRTIGNLRTDNRNLETTNTRLTRDQQQLQTRCDTLETQNDERRGENDVLTTQNRELRTQVQALKREVDELKAKVANLERTNKELGDENRDLLELRDDVNKEEYENNKRDLQNLRNEVEGLRARPKRLDLDTLQATNASLKEARDKSRLDLETCQSDLAIAQSALEALQGRSGEGGPEVDRLNAEIQRLKADLKRRQEDSHRLATGQERARDERDEARKKVEEKDALLATRAEELRQVQADCEKQKDKLLRRTKILNRDLGKARKNLEEARAQAGSSVADAATIERLTQESNVLTLLLIQFRAQAATAENRAARLTGDLRATEYQLTQVRAQATTAENTAAATIAQLTQDNTRLRRRPVARPADRPEAQAGKPSVDCVEAGIINLELYLNVVVLQRAVRGFQKDDTANASRAANKVVADADKLNDHELRAEARYWQGIVEYYSDDRAGAYQRFFEANGICQEHQIGPPGFLANWLDECDAHNGRDCPRHRSGYRDALGFSRRLNVAAPLPRRPTRQPRGGAARRQRRRQRARRPPQHRANPALYVGVLNQKQQQIWDTIDFTRFNYDNLTAKQQALFSFDPPPEEEEEVPPPRLPGPPGPPGPPGGGDGEPPSPPRSPPKSPPRPPSSHSSHGSEGELAGPSRLTGPTTNAALHIQYLTAQLAAARQRIRVLDNEHGDLHAERLIRVRREGQVVELRERCRALRQELELWRTGQMRRWRFW